MRKLFAGLDVGDETTSVCIVGEQGKPVFVTSVETNPEAISTALTSYRRRLEVVGLEAGSTSLWLHRELRAAGYPVRLLDPRRAHALLKTRINKTDANDAFGLALLMSKRADIEVHARSDNALRLRALLVLRASIVTKAADLEHSLRMAKKVWGGERPRKAVQRKRGPADPAEAAFSVAMAATGRAVQALALEAQVLKLTIEEIATENDVCRRLMTVPGIGAITALTFVSTIDDPTRFASSSDVAAFLGLTPRLYQSGGIWRYGRVSKRGRDITRSYLHQASVVLIHRSKSNCRLRRWAVRLAKQKGYRKAYVACARKLAVIMHRLWITAQDFDPGR